MYIHIFYMGNLRILPRVRLSQAGNYKICYLDCMTKTDQCAAYALYFIATSVVTSCLAIGWYMSPLGLGFQTWPEPHRGLLINLYQASYFMGIPAILIVQGLSLVLFIFKKPKAAYWLPVVSTAAFLTCVVSILPNLS